MAEQLDDASVFLESNAEAFTMAPLTLQRVDVAKWEQMPHIQTLCVRRSPFPTRDEVSLIPLSLGLNIIRSDGRFSWCKKEW